VNFGALNCLVLALAAAIVALTVRRSPNFGEFELPPAPPDFSSSTLVPVPKWGCCRDMSVVAATYNKCGRLDD
jgi:hypothetical protein